MSKAKYDGISIQVAGCKDIYHIFNAKEDIYELVDVETKEIFKYEESTIDYHIKQGNWIVLNKRDNFNVGDRISFHGNPGTVTFIPPNNPCVHVRFDGNVYDFVIAQCDMDSLEILVGEDEAKEAKSGGFKPYTRKEFTDKIEEMCKRCGLTKEFKAEIFNKDYEVKPDAVNSPKHYSVFEEVEAIQVIASSMTQDQFYGYCFGNILKYRLRAGGKDDVMQELSKADKYQELYNTHKHLCKEEAL